MTPRLLLAAVFAIAPPAARAAETACWRDAGVLVVPAEVMGVAGDYVLDTGAPQTLLADTPAQGAGFAGTELRGEVRFAGRTFADRPVHVARLDARFYRLPTPVAGVIGADLLRGLVLDVRFAPCRVGLWRAGEAPPFPAAEELPLRLGDGPAATEAAVTDGASARRGAFLLSTGSDTAVRLGEAIADVPGAGRREDLYPYGRLRPRLRALSFAGDLAENLPAGLATAADTGAALGVIGAPVLQRYRLRFDFAGSRLWLAPERAHEKSPPDDAGGP